MTVGENGVLTQAQWANFASEMTAIREKVDLEIASKYINEKKVDIFTEPVKVDDLSGTLKREMLYIMAGMPDEKEPKDYKDNEEDLNFLADDSGNLKGYHYVRAELSDGESKKYIYDEDRDVIYKVKATNILGTKLHTYEYACKLKGVPFRDISSKLDYLINKGSVMVRTGNISYYAPDLENFRSGVVSLVYHKKNKLDETKEVPYYLSGITDQVTINKGILGTEKTYVWYDYSEDSKMWANIKCEDWNYELTTYWTWIPRYAYKITPREVTVDAEGKEKETKPGAVDIKFVDIDGYYYDYSSGTEKKIKAEEKGYTVAAAFNQSEKPLKGIWVAKYEPSKEPLGFKLSKNKEAVNPPDLDGFDKEKTYYVTYGSNGNSDEQALVVKENGKENPPPENWYDYTAGNENTGDIGKRWATIKCVNTVDNKNLTTYWVWIPRYIYRVEQGEVQIIYVDENNKPLDDKYNVYFEEGIFKMGTADDEFKVLAAFEQGGNHLKGIWMSKYEPSMISTEFENSTNPAYVNAPDLSNFNPSNTYYVKYGEDGQGTEQATLVQGNSAPSNWYDYPNKRWANIKCVNTVNGKQVTTYWTWIPRYAYRVTQGQVEIIYIDENNNKLDPKYSSYTIGTGANDFKVGAAFEQGGEHLNGIWVAKYEPSDATK